MSITVSTAVRLAFEAATSDVPKNRRTRLYAMVRSAVNRKIGVSYRRSMWSAQRGSR